MRSWLERLWQFLRRLIVGDDEGGIPGGGEVRPEPNPDTGEELRRFFIELLKGDNLQRFQSRGPDERFSYIDERARPEDWARERADYFDRLGPDAIRLLKSEDLREIEAHILTVTGSGNATLTFTVCPPM
jgi:hypothetical protein